MSLGIIYRLVKKSPLTFAETDGNFRKLEDAYDRLFTAFQEGLPLTAVEFNDYDADQIRFRRADTGSQNNITIDRFAESLIGQAPIQSGPTANSFQVLIADPNEVPGARAKRVGLDALLPPLVEAKQYTNINSLTLLADGRVSVVHSTNDAAGLRSLLKVTELQDFPLPGTSKPLPSPITPALPMFIRVVAVCQADVDGYVANEEINIESISADMASAEDAPAYVVCVNSTNIVIAAQITDSPGRQIYTAKGGGSADWNKAITPDGGGPAKWKWKAYIL